MSMCALAHIRGMDAANAGEADAKVFTLPNRFSGRPVAATPKTHRLDGLVTRGGFVVGSAAAA